MRRIDKHNPVILDNRGETIVEVLVAFTLLSIMLVILSQGITYASKAVMNADDHRDSADSAMIKLQRQTLDTGSPKSVANGTNIYRHVVTINNNGQNYTYVVYTSEPVT